MNRQDLPPRAEAGIPPTALLAAVKRSGDVAAQARRAAPPMFRSLKPVLAQTISGVLLSATMKREFARYAQIDQAFTDGRIDDDPMGAKRVP